MPTFPTPIHAVVPGLPRHPQEVGETYLTIMPLTWPHSYASPRPLTSAVGRATWWRAGAIGRPPPLCTTSHWACRSVPTGHRLAVDWISYAGFYARGNATDNRKEQPTEGQMMDLNSMNSDRHTSNMEHERRGISDHVSVDIEIIDPDGPDGDEGQGYPQFSSIMDLITRYSVAYNVWPAHRLPATIVIDNGEVFVSRADRSTEADNESA